MENQEQAVEVTETEVTQTQETPEANEPKTFTQEQLNSIVANRVAKERDIISQELGLGDKYSKDGFNSFIESTKTASEELNTLKTTISENETKYNTLSTEKSDLEKQLMFNTYDVNEEFQEEFLTLVNSKVSDQVGLMEAAQAVATKFNGSSFTKPKAKDVIIGNNKSSVKAKDAQAAAMERLRNL